MTVCHDHISEALASILPPPHASLPGWPLLHRAGEVLDRFSINTPLRLAHFWAQWLEETGGLRRLEENLNYRPERLMLVWPSRFPNLESTRGFAGNPEALAGKVYGGRMGNVQPGDGWKYRGRGLCQLTGRSAYREIGACLGVNLEDHPELILTPDLALPATCAYWKLRKLNPMADADDLMGITRRINGGLTNIKARADWLRKTKAAFGATE